MHAEKKVLLNAVLRYKMRNMIESKNAEPLNIYLNKQDIYKIKLPDN